MATDGGGKSALSDGSGVPVHKMPLCDCANHGAYCRGRQPGKACMAHDKWYRMPCDEGKCPGPMDANCCRRPHPDAWMADVDA